MERLLLPCAVLVWSVGERAVVGVGLRDGISRTCFQLADPHLVMILILMAGPVAAAVGRSTLNGACLPGFLGLGIKPGASLGQWGQSLIWVSLVWSRWGTHGKMGFEHLFLVQFIWTCDVHTQGSLCWILQLTKGPTVRGCRVLYSKWNSNTILPWIPPHESISLEVKTYAALNWNPSREGNTSSCCSNKD